MVVPGHAGTVSLDALRGQYAVGCVFVQVDHDGRIIAATAPARLDDARLRRALALALSNGIGLAIARDLLREKLRGLAVALGRLPRATDAVGAFAEMLAGLDRATTGEELRTAEAQAAAAYRGAWASVPVAC